MHPASGTPYLARENKSNMKRILVPCDFSDQSNEALRTAIELAGKEKGEIFLLHVLPIPTMYTTGFAGEPIAFDPAFYTQMEKDAKTGLEKMKNNVAPKSLKVTTQVFYGELISSLRKVIEGSQIDIVVMGTSGASGVMELFIGSNTEKVVRFSPVPVLAVRKAVELKSIRNILVPSTLDLNQTAFIDKLKELQHLFDATLHILLVNTPVHFRRDPDANEALDEYAKHYRLENYKLHFRNNIREEDGIMDFAYSEKMDLIAMATHARKGLAHLFNSSVTENVVNHIQIPVWTYCLKGQE
jgi:nucleotide-binding universal stress UspA family protein